jgi:ribulose-phosphate 3-epimerase
MKPEIIPAILSGNLDDYIYFCNLYDSFTDKIHIDVMDGDFVLTKSPSIFEILSKTSHIKAYKAIHLMVKNPINILSILREMKNHIFLVYIHVETLDEETFARLLELKFPFKIGFVFDPRTEFDKYSVFLSKSKIIQIMTVNPGVQQSRFISDTLEKIVILREKYNFKGEIHLDGGINAVTIKEVLNFSPQVINIGSAIQKADNPQNAYKLLKELIN